MKKTLLETLPRLVLGAIFLVSAIDGFWFLSTGANLIHPPTSERGLQFEQALIATGFFWPFMKLVNLVGALCLLSNRAPAFGLALILPVMATIVLFHLFLNPQGMPIAMLLIVCGGLLLRAYGGHYAGLFRSGGSHPMATTDSAQAVSR